MFTRIILLTFLACCGTFATALGQLSTPFRYVRDLPKNLFSAPTAVLIYTSFSTPDSPGSDSSDFEQLRSQLQAENQALHLQLVDFTDGNSISTGSDKAALAQRYNSLNVQNLLLLEYINIQGQGAQTSYRLVLTSFSRNAALVSPKQQAFTLQDNQLSILMQRFAGTIAQYSKGFFDKTPNLDKGYAGALRRSEQQEPEGWQLPSQTRTPDKPVAAGKLPHIRLSEEDRNRGRSGSQHNFFFIVEGRNEELNAGFFGQKLRPHVKNSPEALKYLNRYRNAKRLYLMERFVFAGSVIGYSSEVFRGDNAQYFNDNQKIYIGLATASLISNFFINRNTNLKMKQAVEEYNMYATVKNATGLRWLKPQAVGAQLLGQNYVPALVLTWQIGR